MATKNKNAKPDFGQMRASQRRTQKPPSAWYQQTGQDAWREKLARSGLSLREADPQERADYLAVRRATRVATLSKNLKNLRQFFSGFDSRDGYDLRDVKSWPASRVRTVDKYAEYLNHLQSQTFSRIVPRSKKERAGLIDYTGQRLRRQKAFVVHKPSEKDEVAIGSQGEVVVVRELPTGGFLFTADYIFSVVLGWQPITWDEVVQATKEILPHLPDGNYFILSELHQEIDVPQPKRMLLRIMMRYLQEYAEKAFASTIIGFRRIADNIVANKEYERIYFQRRERAAKREKAWNQLRRASEKRAKRRR